MEYCKSCHSRERFLPHFGNFRGRRGGSDTLIVKICKHNVTKVNNGQRETKWLRLMYSDQKAETCLFKDAYNFTFL